MFPQMTREQQQEVVQSVKEHLKAEVGAAR
jgi:hypothetical protein